MMWTLLKLPRRIGFRKLMQRPYYNAPSNQLVVPLNRVGAAKYPEESVEKSPLEGKNVVYIGGYGGIGLAACQEMANKGIKGLTIVGCKNYLALLEELQNCNQDLYIHFVHFDPKNGASGIQAALCLSLEYMGHFDVLINSSTITNERRSQPMLDSNLLLRYPKNKSSLEEFKRNLSKLHEHIVDTTHSAIPMMSKENGGNGGLIVNISSVFGLEPATYGLVYAAVKQDIIDSTRYFAQHYEQNHTGIQHMGICPGEYITHLLAKYTTGILAAGSRTNPGHHKTQCIRPIITAIENAKNGSVWISDFAPSNVLSAATMQTNPRRKFSSIEEERTCENDSPYCECGLPLIAEENYQEDNGDQSRLSWDKISAMREGAKKAIYKQFFTNEKEVMVCPKCRENPAFVGSYTGPKISKKESTYQEQEQPEPNGPSDHQQYFQAIQQFEPDATIPIDNIMIDTVIEEQRKIFRNQNEEVKNDSFSGRVNTFRKQEKYGIPNLSSHTVPKLSKTESAYEEQGQQEKNKGNKSAYQKQVELEANNNTAATCPSDQQKPFELRQEFEYDEIIPTGNIKIDKIVEDQIQIFQNQNEGVENGSFSGKLNTFHNQEQDEITNNGATFPTDSLTKTLDLQADKEIKLPVTDVLLPILKDDSPVEIVQKYDDEPKHMGSVVSTHQKDDDEITYNAKEALSEVKSSTNNQNNFTSQTAGNARVTTNQFISAVPEEVIPHTGLNEISNPKVIEKREKTNTSKQQKLIDKTESSPKEEEIPLHLRINIKNPTKLPEIDNVVPEVLSVSSLKDKNVAFFGGYQGVPLMACKEMAKKGIKNLIILGGKLSTQQEIRATNPNLKVDFIPIQRRRNGRAGIQSALDKAVKTMGNIDVLVHGNKIKTCYCPKMVVSNCLRCIADTELSAVPFMSREFGHKGGTIINLSAIVGLEPVAFPIVHKAIKRGIINFSKTFAHQNVKEKTGISHMAICPGENIIAAFGKLINDNKNEDLLKSKHETSIECAKLIVKAIEKAEDGTVWVLDMDGRKKLKLQKIWDSMA